MIEVLPHSWQHNDELKQDAYVSYCVRAICSYCYEAFYETYAVYQLLETPENIRELKLQHQQICPKYHKGEN